MEIALAVLLVGLVGGGLLYARHVAKSREAAQRAELTSQLAASTRAADEDVTKFGEELQLLDTDVAGYPHDEAMTKDYQRALDGYEQAKRSLAAVTQPDEVRQVTESLEGGRYASACVKARLADEPLPAERPPCFFNPAHGPSTQNVTWAPPGGIPRDVPACAADAERVVAGADPYIRTVQVGPHRVAYWQGGPAYAPYAQGYYARWQGSDVLGGVMLGGLLFGQMGQPDDPGESAGDPLRRREADNGDVGEGIGDMSGDMIN